MSEVDAKVLIGEIQQKISLQENRINDQEEMIAQIVMAYTELYVITNTIFANMIDKLPEEERKEFIEQLNIFRNNVLNSLKEASQNGFPRSNQNAEGTMEDVATNSKDSSNL